MKKDASPEIGVKVVMDPVSLFYLNLGQVSGAIMRQDVKDHLISLGATEEEIENFRDAAMTLAQTAYGKK